MTKLTDLEAIDLMVQLDETLERKCNASLILTGYGEYLETFKSWSPNLQDRVCSLIEKSMFDEILSLVETQAVDYFYISFN